MYTTKWVITCYTYTEMMIQKSNRVGFGKYVTLFGSQLPKNESIATWWFVYCFCRCFEPKIQKIHENLRGPTPISPPMPPFPPRKLPALLRDSLTTMVPLIFCLLKGPLWFRYKRFRTKQSKDLEDVSKFPAMVPLLQRIRGVFFFKTRVAYIVSPWN